MKNAQPLRQVQTQQLVIDVLHRVPVQGIEVVVLLVQTQVLQRVVRKEVESNQEPV